MTHGLQLSLMFRGVLLMIDLKLSKGEDRAALEVLTADGARDGSITIVFSVECGVFVHVVCFTRQYISQTLSD